MLSKRPTGLMSSTENGAWNLHRLLYLLKGFYVALMGILLFLPKSITMKGGPRLQINIIWGDAIVLTSGLHYSIHLFTLMVQIFIEIVQNSIPEAY